MSAARLRDYALSGGHLVWISGANIDPAEYNALHAQLVDLGKQLMQAMPKFVEQRYDFVMRKQCGLVTDWGREIAGEVGNRMLDRGPAIDAAAVYRIIHPCAATLALARIQVKIKLADAQSLQVGDFEKSHCWMPCGGAGFRYGNAIQRLNHAKHAGQCGLLGKILLHFDI